jgi:hypothetical protein
MTVMSKLILMGDVNAPPSPPFEVDHEPPKLSESSRPIKKRRIDFQRHSAMYPADEHELLKCTEQSQEELTQCMRGNPSPISTEVEVTPKFARGYDTISNFTVGIMAGLEIRQRDFRRVGQHSVFGKRARELLDESWKFTVELMLESFKRGLKCINCQEHHEMGEFSKKIDVLSEKLKEATANHVDQRMLDQIQDEACRIGNEYLQQVLETECRSVGRIWGTVAVGGEKRGARKDSGVELNIPFDLERCQKE